MEVADILKIVIPVIIALCGTVFATLKWTMTRQANAEKAHWELIHLNIKEMVESLSGRLNENKNHNSELNRKTDKRLTDLETKLSDFKEYVADKYMKHENWLVHATSVERKIDHLRDDFNKSFKELMRDIMGRGDN